MAIVNNSVVLPVEYSDEIIRGILGRSKALELGRRLPDMRGKTYKLNVFSNLPVAGWVKGAQGADNDNAEGAEINRKPLSSLAWQGVDLVAEEIAVIVPIAIATLEDVSNYVDIVPQISEQVVGAFQEVLDATLLFGVDSPWSTYGGIVAGATTAGATVAWDGQAGTSFYSAISDAMTLVEESGYEATAILGGPSLRGAFRNTLTTLGINAGDQGEVGSLPRHFDYTGGFDTSSAFAIVGDFKYLVYSFRQEMSMKVLEEATLVNPANGAVLYNLAQQDMIAFRFTMRLGAALPNPVNRVGGAKRYPFAIITKPSEGSN